MDASALRQLIGERAMETTALDSDLLIRGSSNALGIESTRGEESLGVAEHGNYENHIISGDHHHCCHRCCRSVMESCSTTTTWVKSGRFGELVACLFIFALTFSVYEAPITKPHQRPIPYQQLENSGDYVKNLVNNESFEGETISGTMLVILAYLIPLAVQETISYLRARQSIEPRHKSFYYDMHATLCAYMLASSLNLVVTETVKIYVGYLRPIFYEGCIPDENYQYCTAEDGGGDSIRKSFPSGHASMSFCGLSLLTLYVHTRFGMAQSKKSKQSVVSVHHAQGDIRGTTAVGNWQQAEAETLLWEEDYVARLISVLSLLPLSLALYIATSRIVDNKHFPADTVGGAVVGAAVALFTHSLWF